VSRYAIEQVMSTSAPYAVFDGEQDIYMCQCETESAADFIIKALEVQDCVSEGDFSAIM
jgi:hypothetical protein